MDTKTVFVPLCVAILATALVIFLLNYPRPAAEVDPRLQDALTDIDSEPAAREAESRTRGRLPGEYTPAERRQRLEWLQRQVEKKTAEVDKLKTELQQSQSLIDRLLAESYDFEDPLSAVSRDSESRDGTAVKPAGLGSKGAAERPGGEESVDSLRREVQRAHDELASLESEYSAALRQEQELRGAASQVIVESGRAAVPTLVRLLNDREPTVRAWAAYLLGEMGANATSAIPSLADALVDPDSTVRMEARAALERIESDDDR